MWNQETKDFANIFFHKGMRKRTWFGASQCRNKKGGAKHMWTESTMPIGQSVIVSLLGISVVFLTLIVLSLAIILISKILGAIIKDKAQKPAAAAAAPVVSDEPDKEMLAVLMATIGEDLGVPTDQFRILNVTELK